MINRQTLRTVVEEVLNKIPRKPRLCVPISAVLYAILKDDFDVDAKLVTGDLSYDGESIFKQDFSIINAQPNTLQLWGGHAWVEIEGLVCDGSIFRTLFSDEFTKPCKKELVSKFGNFQDYLIASKSDMFKLGLSYNAIEYIDDNFVGGIIAGWVHLL
jgi:hypothetical protein